MRAQLQVKTRLALLLFFMLALTLLAVAMGWYAMPSASEARSASAALVQRQEQATYVFMMVAVLAVLLALLTYLTVVRKATDPMLHMAALLANLAQGNLTNKISVRSTDEPGQMYANAKALQDAWSNAVGTVREGVSYINHDIKQLVSSNSDLTSRTEQQATALEQTASSIQQLSGTVRQNADHARQANQLAVTASQVAQRGGDAVGEVVATMHGISTSSHKIADIVGVIDSIAFQTNILALNAAVEAARAGEQGKGFAVVASEVRALAQRSAHAAKEIKDLIEDSVKKVTEGSGQVERAGATMEEIVTSVARVTDIMGEISAATTEQAEGIDQINQAIGQMDGMTRQNAQLVHRSTEVAADLDGRVNKVSTALLGFQVEQGVVVDVTSAHAATVKTERATAQVNAPKLSAGAARHAAGSAPALTGGSARSAVSKTTSGAGTASSTPRNPAIARKPASSLTAASATRDSDATLNPRGSVAGLESNAGASRVAPPAPGRYVSSGTNESHREDDWEEF